MLMFSNNPVKYSDPDGLWEWAPGPCDDQCLANRQQIDARNVVKCFGTWNGSSCTAQFDPAGRPLRLRYSDSASTPTVTYVYEAASTVQVNNSVAEVRYRFDALGRVKRRAAGSPPERGRRGQARVTRPETLL